MTDRFASGRSWLASPAPPVAVEISATRVVAVSLAGHGGRPVVTSHAAAPLEAGVAVPSLNAANVLDERALAAVISGLLAALGQRTRRIALVLPDSTAKVSLLRFEKVPEKAQDLDQLIRWQVRKSVPFRIEDAQVAWQPGAPVDGGGREYLVTVARRDVVHGYERACEAAGVHAGLVDLASFNQINAVLAGGEVAGDWLLVSVAADYATLAVVRGGDVISYRNRSTANEGDLADLVHQTTMYHEDRLGGGGFARVLLAGASVLNADESTRLRRGIEERIGVRVHPLDFTAAVELGQSGSGPDLLDRLGAPVGILLRELAPRRVAAGRAAAGVA